MDSKPGRSGSGSLLLAASLVLVAGVAASGGAQRFSREPAPEPVVNITPYDGRFTFARLKYTTGPGGFYYMGLPAWAHGYPKAEFNLIRIAREITTMKTHLDASNALTIDDPRLAKYPVAYMSEAGYWTMNAKEALALRAYLQKGGFIIFDDFRDGRGVAAWANFEANIKRAIPDAHFIDLEPSHPIFHSFFEINSFSIIPQPYGSGRPILRALFENNDPKQRMLAMVNFNTDVSDFWEFSDTGMYLVTDSNEGYKLGVNYLVYALTH